MSNQPDARIEGQATATGTPDAVGPATLKMLIEAQQKFHENRLGTKTIQSVNATSNGYEVTLDQRGHHSTLKFDKGDLGSATTLALVGPDVYERMRGTRAFGNRALLTGGALAGAAQTGWKEWSTNPGKALGDIAATATIAAGLTAGTEALPLTTGTVTAGLIGWGGAQLYHAFPDFAKRAGTVKNFYDRAGHTDGAAILNQARQTSELIGPDLFHVGNTVFGAALGGRLGLGIRGVTGDLEASIAPDLKAAGQNFVDTMKEAPAIIGRAFTLQEAKLAFANAMSADTSTLENGSMPWFFKNVGRASEGPEEPVEISQPQKSVAQLGESTLKRYREAKTPKDLFPEEDDWKQTPEKWVRDTRASRAGNTHKLSECFVPGRYYSIEYEGPLEHTRIHVDFSTGQEVKTLFPVQDYEEIYRAFETGDGKVYPKPNFTGRPRQK